MDVNQFKKGNPEKIVIIGLGYVGLPLAVLFDTKYNVIGYDINPRRIKELKEGYDRTKEVEPEKLKNCQIDFTDNPEKISQAKVIIVTVPTPIDEHNIPDLRPILSASKTVGKYMKKGSIVVYESTVYPGLTEEECVPILEKESGLKWKEDFNVGYSPERVNPGDKQHTIDKIKKVVAGDTPEITEFLAGLYGEVITAGIHKAPNIKTAEAAKVIENTQRDLNIALMNELSIIFNKMGIDTKEVLEAASTKWNFLRFEPGLVGGHCQIGSEYITVKQGNKIFETTFKDFVEKIKPKKIVNFYGTDLIFPQESIEVLSFDPVKENFDFLPVRVFTKRKYDNLLKIKLSSGQEIVVSDKHPFIVKNKDSYDGKLACQLQKGDEIPLTSKLPTIYKNQEINLIDTIKDTNLIDKLRIKPINKKWKDFDKFTNYIAKNYLGKKVSNYFYNNYLPLKEYLKIREYFIKHYSEKDLVIVSGRGPSFGSMPAVIEVDTEFARFVGYYLSEGCLTQDKKSSRIRLTLNKQERQLLQDIKSILSRWRISYSIYEDKKFDSLTIKISNKVFGYLIEKLELGKNSYDTKIPDILMYNTDEVRIELLKGLFRGDGGVSVCKGTPKISYFTSSKVLYHQITLLLLNFGIFPFHQKRKGYIEIYKISDLRKMKDFFLDSKREKLENALQTKKDGESKNYYIDDKFFIVKVKEIQPLKDEEYVYSLEVPKSKNYITTGGVITHNCIGVDPYYLTFKAQAIGYHPEVILAGRRINDYMGKYVAENTVKKLIKAGKPVKGSKVLILGLTFKENISDIRNTKVIDVYNELKEYGVEVYIYDPYAYPDEVKHEYGIELLDNIEKHTPYDAVIVAVKHKPFIEELDFKQYKKLMNNGGIPILIDVKGIYNKEKALKEGFLYWRL
ncbi:MAG: nucleotide sugar dehydrogenase [Sulfurihydrogenibium azorense]|nr:nucleotide sugar dehydrogenase [Sulfurihydrogenibium azorense]MDM7274252.1 nucleotide sugar dehydrogenase [Sulfurihydrogenibium azorense]